MAEMIGTSTSAVSIGKYKGVMLCNRPFQRASSTLTKENRFGTKPNNNVIDNSKAAFLAGNPGRPLGLNVPIFNESAHAIRRDKKNSALSKHRKWIHDLQKERTRLLETLTKEEEVFQTRREKFLLRETKLRGAVCIASNGSDDVSGARVAEEEKSKLNRPMWALTKATADEKLDKLEDAEANDLIDFVNNLDIDQFMNDVENKARVAQVEQQLTQVQSIVDYEEAEEKRSERDQQRLEDGAGGGGGVMNGNDLSQLGWDRADAKDGDNDALSVATSVFSKCKLIRSVHSIRSITAITERMESKLGMSALSEAGGTFPAPHIVTIDEAEGARMQVKTLVSNLPYMHRNPAI